MKHKFYRKVLKNGMTVLLEKRETPVVSVAFAIRCGGVNESSKEKGGILNGFKDETITAYWCKMPSKHLSVALDVLSDMVKNPLFDEKEFEKEKHVIFEEIKMYKDSPSHHVFHEIQRSLYKEPLGAPLIGTEETLNSLTRKKIIERFKKVYQPNNIVLCVVGNADFSKIVKFAEKNFGKKKGEIPKFKIIKKNSSKIEKRKGIDQANLVFAYHVPTPDKKTNH